jgi:hypothetical protein
LDYKNSKRNFIQFSDICSVQLPLDKISGWTIKHFSKSDRILFPELDEAIEDSYEHFRKCKRCRASNEICQECSQDDYEVGDIVDGPRIIENKVNSTIS